MKAVFQNQPHAGKPRIVTMADLNRLGAAVERMVLFSAEAEGVANQGNEIVLKATGDGNAAWAQRFGLETLANLTEQRRAVIVEFESATEAFTGEKRKAGENSQDFLERIVEAFSDNTKLGPMLTRNNITFIGVGS